jgi:hypothetical protein
MTFNNQDKRQGRNRKPVDHEKSLAEKRLLIDKLRNSLINSQKENGKDTGEIEFLLRRL